MNYDHQKSKRSGTQWTTYFLTIIVILAGIILISLGVHFEEKKFLSILLTTLGVAFIVSISTSLLYRHFAYITQFKEMLLEMEKKLHDLLKLKFDILDSCSYAGIRHIYPNWYPIYKNILPERLASFEHSFIAIGIALSELSRSLASGELRKLVNQKLSQRKEFIFCIVHPDSEAVSYRKKEHGFDTAATVRASLTSLEKIKIDNLDSNFKIKALKDITPRATMICIDNEVIYFSPYFSSEPYPSSWVIETHNGEEFFNKLKKDIDHLLRKSIDYESNTTASNSG